MESKIDFEVVADSIDTYLQNKKPISTSMIEDPIVDYVFRCVKGVFKGKFIYINLTPEGEIFGSDIFLENAGLSLKHAEIKYNLLEKKYVLKDLGSESGTWIKLRPETPILIQENTYFRIEDDYFKLTFDDTNFDEIFEWLKRTEVEKLYDFLFSKNIRSLEQLNELSDDDIKNLDLNKIEQNKFIDGLNELDEDFSDDYLKCKLILSNLSNNHSPNKLLEVKFIENFKIGWSGAIIGSYSNADLVIQPSKEDVSQDEAIELRIQYHYGKYWLVSGKYNANGIYVKLQNNEQHILVPDDIINIGELDFLVQRFNTGCYEDKGTRPSMEDMTLIRQDIGVSSMLNVSFFAVFDGHAGKDCVKYISDFFIENLRNRIVKGEPFDEQINFYRYVHDFFLETAAETDYNFFVEYKDYSLNSGCTAVMLFIVGDIVFCANVGDSRAILSRIEEAGGEIQNNRLFGQLAISRAFGDFKYKPKSRGDPQNLYKNDLIISIPEDEFILMACDGLFDIFSSQESVNYIRERLAEMPLMEQDPQVVARDLAYEAVREATLFRKNSDNVSVLLITLTRGIVVNNVEKSFNK